MSEAAASPEKSAAQPAGAAHGPTHDWTLMALCGIATIMGLCAVWVLIVRIEVPKEEITDLPCMILLDPHMPVRGRPNTSCTPLLRELGRIEYKFNDCGHRTNLPCSAAPPGTIRIVALGSSLVEGAGVPVEDTFVSRLPASLERAASQKYDAYSMGMLGGTPRSVLLRIDEVFPLKPSVVLWPLTIFDLDHVNFRAYEIPGKQRRDERRPADQASDPPSVLPGSGTEAGDGGGSRWAGIYNSVEESRYVFLLEHLLYKSQSMYESHFGAAGEGVSGNEFPGFLEINPPQSWREHLDDFEFYFRQVASKLNERGIRLVVLLVPHRMQTDMVSTGRWPAGKDPYALGRRLEPIVRKYGTDWIDILHDFRRVPDTDRLFFPVNGHMTVEGHRVLASMISQELEKNVFAGTALSARRTP